MGNCYDPAHWTIGFPKEMGEISWKHWYLSDHLGHQSRETLLNLADDIGGLGSGRSAGKNVKALASSVERADGRLQDSRDVRRCGMRQIRNRASTHLRILIPMTLSLGLRA